MAKAAEKLFVLEDLQNLGADYERTLLAWERNFARSWDRFEARYGVFLPHVALLSPKLRWSLSWQKSSSLSGAFFKGQYEISPSPHQLASP